MSFCYFTWFFDHIRNLPFRLQHQIALLVVMVPPSAVFTQLTAAGIRAVGSVGTVVHVAHHVGVAPLACTVAVEIMYTLPLCYIECF